MGSGSYQSVDLGLPGEQRFAANPVGGHVALLCDFAPASVNRRCRPVRHDVFGGPAAVAAAHEVRKVRHHYDQIIDARPAPTPDYHALAFVEIDVDEVGV